MEARLRRVLLLIEDGADAEEVGRVDWGRWVGESGRKRFCRGFVRVCLCLAIILHSQIGSDLC